MVRKGATRPDDAESALEDIVRELCTTDSCALLGQGAQTEQESAMLAILAEAVNSVRFVHLAAKNIVQAFAANDADALKVLKSARVAFSETYLLDGGDLDNVPFV